MKSDSKDMGLLRKVEFVVLNPNCVDSRKMTPKEKLEHYSLCGDCRNFANLVLWENYR